MSDSLRHAANEREARLEETLAIQDLLRDMLGGERLALVRCGHLPILTYRRYPTGRSVSKAVGDYLIKRGMVERDGGGECGSMRYRLYSLTADMREILLDVERQEREGVRR